MQHYQPRIHLVELSDSNTSSYTGRAAPRIKVAVSSTAAARASWSASASDASRANAGSGNSNEARDEAETGATRGTLTLEVDVDTARTRHPQERGDAKSSEYDSLGIEHVLRAVGALSSGGNTWTPVAVHTFIFRQLCFIAVTAYQNQLVRIPPDTHTHTHTHTQ